MASCRNNSGGFGFESEFVVRCQFASGVRETREREREREREIEALPLDEQALSHMVLFSLRVGDVAELNKLLRMARLKPHVVLQIL